MITKTRRVSKPAAKPKAPPPFVPELDYIKASLDYNTDGFAYCCGFGVIGEFSDFIADLESDIGVQIEDYMIEHQDAFPDLAQPSYKLTPADLVPFINDAVDECGTPNVLATTVPSQGRIVTDALQLAGFQPLQYISPDAKQHMCNFAGNGHERITLWHRACK